MERTTILHISDFHIRHTSGKTFDQDVVLQPLIERVQKDREEIGLKPELIFVTGDLSFRGKTSELETAKEFLDQLCQALDLTETQLFVVPGNHDVDRNRYRPNDVPKYNSMAELNRELAHPEYLADLLKGQAEYFDFMDQHYSHLRPLGENLVPFVQSYQTQSGRRLGIMGLNSAILCRCSPDKGLAALGEYQLQKAKDALAALDPCDLNMACFHHPVDWLWLDDQDIARTHLDEFLIFTGHLHKGAAGYLHDSDGQFFLSSAGGAYLGSDSKHPMGYQYLSIDWEDSNLILDFRTYFPRSRKWIVDAARGDDGTAVIPCSFLPVAGKGEAGKNAHGLQNGDGPEVIPTPEFHTIPDNCRKLLKENCRYMNIEYLQEKGQAITVSLPELFIRLYADDPDAREKNREHSIEDMRSIRGIPPVNIQDLILAKHTLVIEGRPGSGKTTLLKHLSFLLADGNSRVESIQGWFPALIFLKRLNQRLPKENLTLETVLGLYFDGERKALATCAFSAARAGKCLFLVDGLDEMGREERDLFIHCLADFGASHPGNKYILAGRPHGISAGVLERFGRWKIVIKDLEEEQRNWFINAWFKYLFMEDPGEGRKRSLGLIQEMQGREELERFVDTPLMLTAVCILYHNGKRLPQHRAELYLRFTEHLLVNRFGEEWAWIRAFLARMAHGMQEQNVSEIGRKEALQYLEAGCPKDSEQGKDDHNIQLGKKFDGIEPRCGLLVRDNGAHRFSHLTFQEFLAALHIADDHHEYIDSLAHLWEKDHYKETLSLLIAYLSLSNRAIANNVVATVLERDPQGDYLSWITAINGLCDIHGDRQTPQVVQLAREKIITMVEGEISPKLRAELGDYLSDLGDLRDLKSFLPVSAGKYTLAVGADKEEKEVTLSDWELSQYPVTNAWFKGFVDDNGYGEDQWWSPEGLKWKKQTQVTEPGGWQMAKWNKANHPVIGISWYEAHAFCQWMTATMDDGYQYCLPSAASHSLADGKQY